MPVPLETYISSVAAQPQPTIGITIAVDGHVYVGQSKVSIDRVSEEVRLQQEAQPDAAIYLVIEDGEAVVDRGPMLTKIWDQLRANGLEIFLVGAPKEFEEGAVE